MLLCTGIKNCIDCGFSFRSGFIILLFITGAAAGPDSENYISTEAGTGKFPLVVDNQCAPLFLSSRDFPGVIRVAKHLQADINRVTGVSPGLIIDSMSTSREIVLIGTLGKNSLLEQLLRDKKIDVRSIKGKWESYMIQVVEDPFPNIDRALVLAGSDKRGTIYAMFDLSENIGVSPWYWWADVPAVHHSTLYVKSGPFHSGEPKVKYRGIFINDEAPALSGWVYENFGGFNHKFYQHVFELILRMKGNFLWPAMWGRAFYDDDPENPELANEYGIVIGTSHHEPMMRAHDEWRRYGSGAWNYENNEVKLKEFWAEGIKRMNDYESIVTLAMRGDGDMPMSQEANIALLEKIVKDQREILNNITGKPVENIPQVWALYKEVQEYYDKGMRVPEDVTLLLCDDNWGNIRKLPKVNDKPRSGGYGIYYHYDYVGGPRNYKWLNTNQISRVWEQMHLAYNYGVNQIWIVNVGDIKPMEYPIEFFLDYAWDPDKWPAERLPEYSRLWAERKFGEKYAQEIAEIVTAYTRFNSRRKPELLSPDTYSLTNFREAETVVSEYNKLTKKAKKIQNDLPPGYADAFYQLVLHPVEACSNLNDLYVTVARNRQYAVQGRASTDELAERARNLFETDAQITKYYNTVMANGKWNHMMDQTHIGYTYWQEPKKNSMPKVTEIEMKDAPEMGVSIEGSTKWWPFETGKATLPEFDPFNRQSHYIEIFNRGKTSFNYSISTDKSWILIDNPDGNIIDEKRLEISIDWSKAPKGKHCAPISIQALDTSKVEVQVCINNPDNSENKRIIGFVESNHYISIEAEHFTHVVEKSPVKWQIIPQLGRTLSGITPFPVTSPAQLPGGKSPRLEYSVYLYSEGDVTVNAFLSPTINFHNDQGLRYGVSFDDESPQIINMHADFSFQDWEESVRNNIIIKSSVHSLNKPGKHVLKFWMVDPGIVLQKLVVETGDIPSSYLGPPESYFITGK